MATTAPKSALQKHREALLERAVRLQNEREEKRAAKRARELAELRSTGLIVPYDAGPIADMVKELKEPKKGWFNW